VLLGCSLTNVTEAQEIPSEVALWRLAANRFSETEAKFDAMLAACSANN
jgi:hypothetical protein